MRMLGTIEGQAKAEQFVAHLLTLGVSTHVEAVAEKPDQWDVWIRDEDKLPLAKGEFIAFLADPNQLKYAEALKSAQGILKAQKQKAAEAAKNYRPARALRGSAIPPMTLTLIILCFVATLLSDFMHPTPQNQLGQTIWRQLSFVEDKAFEQSRQDPLASIRQGQFWRVLTPIFLHGSPIHLLVNMFMLFQFGKILETREGTSRFGLIVILIGILSNLLQGLMPIEYLGSPRFGGISGVVYGLFGYQWVKSTFRPDLLPQLPNLFVIIMLVWLGAGFSDQLSRANLANIANLAHLGGLVSGAAIGWIGKDWRRSRSPSKS